MKLSDILLRGDRVDQPDPEDVPEATLYYVEDESITEQAVGATGARTWESYADVSTIAAGAITNTELADMAASTIKGRAVGAGTGDPTDLTATQATAILNGMVGDSGAGGTKGLVPAPAAGDAAANKYLKANGTWSAPTPAVPAGALSGSSATGVSENLSTLGTIDWMSLNANTTIPRAQQVPACKKTGPGQIVESFQFLTTSGATIFTGASGLTITATAGDSSVGALSLTNVTAVFKSGAVGLGFKFRAPAGLVSRKLRVLSSVFSASYSMTATLSDGSASAFTTTRNTGAGAGELRIFTFDYNAASEGQWLTVVAEITIDNGSSPNIGCNGITLGT